MEIIHPLKPIYDHNSKVLILGSMPSVKSREEMFYYAHPANRFWQVMEKLFNLKLTSKEEKEQFLLKHNIALWDVFRKVNIKGSSDASIKNYQINDLNIILNYANIKAIFCTGKTAFNALQKNFKTNIPIIYLSSPSSANATKSLDELVYEYQKILNYLKK